MNEIFHGALAGAAGTMALDIATYTDMAARGRAPSEMTQLLAQKSAQRFGFEPLAASEPDDATKNRQIATGSLIGYGVGIGAGIVYGLLRGRLRAHVSLPVAALAVGLAVMAVTDGTATALGATDPRQWKRADWIADLIPHLIYGVETACVFEALAGPQPG